MIHRRDGDTQLATEAMAQPVVLLCVPHHITAAMDPQQCRCGLADVDRSVQPHTDTGTQNQHLDAIVAPAGLQAAQRPDEPQRPRTDHSPWGEAGESAEVGVKIGARHRSSIANANRRHVAGSAVSGENILRMTGFPGVGFPPPDLVARSVEFMASAAV
jgi:hypothetical protein